MGRKSSIASDPAISQAVDQAIREGLTIDEIVERLKGHGLKNDDGREISRSAVGRYAQSYTAMVKNQRDLEAVYNTMGAEIRENDNLGRLVIQLAKTQMLRGLLEAEASDETATPKQLADIARATKDIASASKISVEQEAKIREEVQKRAKAEAALAAEGAARSSGATEATIDMVRRAILGID